MSQKSPVSPLFRLAALALSLALVALGSGCASDLYMDCSFDGSSPDPRERECAENDRSTCVAATGDCNTDLCMRYQDEAPYCTDTCEEDSDCRGGECIQVEQGSSLRYCVQTAEE
jgi:hypothetical protein